MNNLQEKLKQAQYFVQRNTKHFGHGDLIEKECEFDCEHSHHESEACAHFTLHTDKQLDEIVRKGGEAKALQADGNANTIPNFIVDVFVLHNKPQLDGNGDPWPPAYANRENLTDEQCRSGVQSLHDAIRNRGHHYQPHGVDFEINVGMGNVYHINGHDTWGDKWDYGVQYGDSNGVSPSTVIEHCKKNVANTWGDGSRYAIITYPRLSKSGTVTGFAWVGVAGSNRLAGHFVRTSYFGDENYKRDTDPKDYYLNHKTGSKTPVHEFAHSMGLYHTFNATDDCIPHTNPLIQGDRILDTNQHTRYDGCGLPSAGNPFNNHMSYSYPTKRVVFTQGQKERVDAVVANQYPDMFNNPVYNWEDDNTPQPVLGCMDETALNYNPLATQDDGSCKYEVPDTPTYREDRIGFINAAHNFSFIAPEGFVGELFCVKNSEGIEIPIVYDECGNNNLSCVAARILNGDSYTLSSITDTITKDKHSQADIRLLVHEDKICIDPENGGLIFKGLEWTDYFYSILGYQTKPQSEIMAYVVKRKGWNQSPCILYTNSANNGNLIYDNTPNNRQESNVGISIDSYVDLTVARNEGLFLNGEKVLDKGKVTEQINDKIMSVGNDYETPGRGCGAYIFEVTIAKHSPNEANIKDFVFSREVDYNVTGN